MLRLHWHRRLELFGTDLNVRVFRLVAQSVFAHLYLRVHVACVRSADDRRDLYFDAHRGSQIVRIKPLDLACLLQLSEDLGNVKHELLADKHASISKVRHHLRVEKVADVGLVVACERQLVVELVILALLEGYIVTIVPLIERLILLLHVHIECV